MTDQLTHFNDQNRAKMVDVTDKAVTHRVATATGQITMQPATCNAFTMVKSKRRRLGRRSGRRHHGG